MTTKTKNTMIGAAVIIGVVVALVYLKKQNDKKKLTNIPATTPATNTPPNV